MMLFVWYVLVGAVALIGIVFYYIYGPGYEMHLSADDPPINPQHPVPTQKALQFVRAYARANGKTTDFERIITTPQGGFDVAIGDTQSFMFDPTSQKMTVRTIVDTQLDAAITPALQQFTSHALLRGGRPEFAIIHEANTLLLVHEFTAWADKKVAFVKLTEQYGQAAKDFDLLILEYLKKSQV